MSFDHEKISQGVRMILEAIGADFSIKDIQDTPDRVARMYDEIMAGMEQTADDAITLVLEEEHDEIILVKDIPFHSMCEHHILPFYGKVHIAYLPDKKITGLSKLARLVDVFAKRVQVQERMTTQIAEAMMEKLSPRGVFVVVEAEHMCMTMRGAKKPGSYTTTSAIRGIFQTDSSAKQEALSLIYRG